MARRTPETTPDSTGKIVFDVKDAAVREGLRPLAKLLLHLARRERLGRQNELTDREGTR